MQLVPTNIAVADYVDMLRHNEVRVNQDYQRNDNLWTPKAKSYFIETMLLNYPMPKISLYQILDLKTQKVFKEIVDGQQRSEAIREFLDGKLILTKNIEREEFKGRPFKEITKERQEIFLSYALPVDLFTSATPREVRSIFRRINSYTAPLNYEERRHAAYQGEFKWYVNKLSSDLEGRFERLGVFTERSFARMQDLRLIAELSDALLNGIRTTKPEHLDQLYKNYDKDFPEADTFQERIEWSVDEISLVDNLANSPIARSYMMYALILALIHRRYKVRELNSVFQFKATGRIDRAAFKRNISELAEALENADGNRRLAPLVDAGGSNVKDKRETRFKEFCKVLDQ